MLRGSIGICFLNPMRWHSFTRPIPSSKCLHFSSISSSPNNEELKEKLITDITRKLQGTCFELTFSFFVGPLVDEKGRIPTGSDRPVAIEVDGPSHFYVNTTRYTAYTKLKHRLLTRMGYRVLHVPYFEWRKLRGIKERENYMREKLKEEPTEWLDPEDEEYYSGRAKLVAVSDKPPPPSTPRPSS